MAQIPTIYLRHLEYLRNLHLQAPHIGNPYIQDTALQQYTQYILADKHSFRDNLIKFGDRLNTIYLQAAKNAEINPPKLEQFDSYGRRIDKLHLSEGWKQLAKYSAQDGIVATAYEEDIHGLRSMKRYGQLVMLYLYQPSSGLYGCPLAMTDGAAYVLRQWCLNIQNRKSYLHEAYEHLISRKQPWTSGQWMTEKKGGSDVSNTQTLAVRDNSSEVYRLYGYKWFTSATDSQIALSLAKLLPYGVQPTAEVLANTTVSLFLIKLRNKDGELNRMQIVRLKDKLGTRQLPTAQILLKGSQAYLIGRQGDGVKMISKMLTITRIYNAATAVGIMRRGICLLRDYSYRRKIGKKKLSQLPLHLRVLSDLQVIHRGNLIFYLHVSQLLSKQHDKSINAHQANILRIITPILKLWTAKQCLSAMTEILQGMGGLGYIQGTMLPTLLRDAQVLTIWQGTTNVLCYDFVRALLKTQNRKIKNVDPAPSPFQSMISFYSGIFHIMTKCDVQIPTYTKAKNQLIKDYTKYMKYLQEAINCRFKGKQSQLRNICYTSAKLFIGMLLLRHSLMTMRQLDFKITLRWVQRGLYVIKDADDEESKKDRIKKNLLNENEQDDRILCLDLDAVGIPRGIGNQDRRGVMRPRF